MKTYLVAVTLAASLVGVSYAAMSPGGVNPSVNSGTMMQQSTPTTTQTPNPSTTTPGAPTTPGTTNPTTPTTGTTGQPGE